MAELVQQTIEWIDRAPVRITARAESSAPPSAVFAVLADHERWPEWFPMVRKVTVLGPAAGIGARRRVTIPGSTVEEEFIAWEPGVRFAFTGATARPRLTKSLLEDCRLSELASGGTAIEYSMYLDPPSALRPFVKVVKRIFQANNQKAVRHLAARAAAPPSAG